MGNVYTVNEILVGALSDRPAPDRNIILYVDSATGKASLADGTSWNDFGGVSIDGLLSDGLTPPGIRLPGAVSASTLSGPSARPSDALDALFVTAPVHLPTLYTNDVTGDPLFVVATGFVTMPTASVVLASSSQADPSFGDSYYGQSTTELAGQTIGAVQISIRRDASLLDASPFDITIWLYDDNAGTPGSQLGHGHFEVHGSEITEDWQDVRFMFSTPIAVSGTAWLVFQMSSQADDAVARVFEVKANTDLATTARSTDEGATWAIASDPVVAARYYNAQPLLIHSATQFDAGIGVFGHAAPSAPRTLAQSAITAITDANAKTAVQALANALSDMGALTLT